MKKTLDAWYGPNPQESESYARIVADRHVDRIASMLNNRTSGEIAIGGQIDKTDRYIAPTLVINVKHDDPSLMGNEIFGPVLPVITYNDIDEAIGLINKRYVCHIKKFFCLIALIENPHLHFIFSQTRKSLLKKVNFLLEMTFTVIN